MPLVGSTETQGKNWSLSPDWLLILTGAPQVEPPLVERMNQMRLLQVELTLLPGSLPTVLQPASPERSFQAT